MGFLDWLFRRESKASQPVIPELAEAPEEADFAEQTTFVNTRLSPKAQAEIKKLRDIKGRGSSKYNWVCSQYGCFESKSFASKGPYEIQLGLARAAPVPGRDTECDCDCTVEAVD